VVAQLHHRLPMAVMEIHPCSGQSLQLVVAVADLIQIMDDQAVLAVEQEPTPPQEDQLSQDRETLEDQQAAELVLEQAAEVAQADQEVQDLAAALAALAHLGQAMVVLMQVVAVVAEVLAESVQAEQEVQAAARQAAAIHLIQENLVHLHRTILEEAPAA